MVWTRLGRAGASAQLEVLRRHVPQLLCALFADPTPPCAPSRALSRTPSRTRHHPTVDRRGDLLRPDRPAADARRRDQVPECRGRAARGRRLLAAQWLDGASTKPRLPPEALQVGRDHQRGDDRLGALPPECGRRRRERGRRRAARAQRAQPASCSQRAGGAGAARPSASRDGDVFSCRGPLGTPARPHAHLPRRDACIPGRLRLAYDLQK